MKAIITGASRGLGFEIAKAFCGEKWEVILIAKSKERLTDAKKELIKTGSSRVTCISVDLSSDLDRNRLIDFKKEFQGTSILVNNVGIYKENNPTAIQTKELQSFLELNLYASIELTQLVLPELIKSKGHIFNIGSVMSINPLPHANIYAISKQALKAWSDTLRESLRTKSVSLTALYPGAINTSSWDGVDVDKKAMIQPEDIAKLIISILSLGKSSSVDEVCISPLHF